MRHDSQHRFSSEFLRSALNKQMMELMLIINMLQINERIQITLNKEYIFN